ncbi:CHAT domain-containing protein [Nonomuraea sp. NPDC002799]
MTDPAGALAARIERFEQAADPGLIWDPAALAEAEQAMRACAGDQSDAVTWRLIGILHLARYRLDQHTTQDAAVAGAFFAAVAVVDPGRLPEKLRGTHVPPGDSAGTWAGLVEEVFRHVDPGAYRHVGLLIHALVRRAMARPVAETSDRLGQFLLQESMRSPAPGWAPGALAALGGGLVRLYGETGERRVVDDAVHVLFRAALAAPAGADPGSSAGFQPESRSESPMGSQEASPAGPHSGSYLGELTTALGLAAPGDELLVRAYLAAAEAAPAGQDRSQALLALADLTRTRAAESCADADLLAFIRVAQCALDFWHDQGAHPGVVAPYAAGLVEWFVVSGNERSLEAGMEMLEALHTTPDETARRLGADPVLRLALLGDRRWRRYGVTGDLADLEVAVEVMREAARTAPRAHPDRARLLTNLANALLRQAIVTGGDPAEPIAAARAALAAHRDRDPAAGAQALMLLGQALKRDLTMERAGEAIAALREAVGVGERPAFRAEAYALLSEVLRWRATRTDPRTPGQMDAHSDASAETHPDVHQNAHPGLLHGRAEGQASGDAAGQSVGGAAERSAGRAAGGAAGQSAEGAAGGAHGRVAGRAERRAADLHDAVLAARQGAELAMKGGARDQAPVQRELCAALLARFAALRDPRDLTEALVLARDVIVTVDTDVNMMADVNLNVAAETDANADAGLLARLRAVLDDPASLPLDEPLAQAATDLALQTRDEDVTLKLLRYAERQAASPGDHLLGVALRLAELGRFRTANRVLGRASEAFDRAGQRSRTAYALSRMGANYENQADLGRALKAYGRSATVYSELGDHRSEALQLGSVGVIHLRAGDPASAVEHHLRAIALCERAGLAAEEASAQGHAADAYLAAGDPDGAVGCAVRARELFLELGETEEAAAALVHAARAAVDQGDLTASGERIAACAIELEAAGAWEEACRALDAHAVLLAERGHHAQAASCEARLVEIMRRRGRRREPADEWYRIAQRRRARADADGARQAFELAEHEYESIGHHDGTGSVRYNLGALAYAEGTAQRALEEFGVAGETFARLRAPAKEAAALTMRACCLTGLGRLDEALADLERALELAAAEGDLEALLTATLGRAALNVAAGEPQEAGERLRAALGLAAGDPLREGVVRDRLAGLAARTGDTAAQVAALERATAAFRAAGQDRLAAFASVKLGFALEERGEFRRARAALEQGIAGLESAGRTEGAPFEVVAAMADALDAEVLARLAAIQLTLGDLTRGRATLIQALTTFRAVGAARRDEADRLELWLRLAEAEARGDLGAARTLAEQALTAVADRPPMGADPDRSYLLGRLSRYCRALGDLAAAREHAARGYELRDGRVIEHLRNLGSADRELGRTADAIEHLVKAVALARESDTALPIQLASALDALGLSLADEGRWAEAARAYEEGLVLLTEPVWRALRAPLLAHRGALHLKLGELEEAAARYRGAISIKEELGDRSELAASYADLGLAQALRGSAADALPLAERALDLARDQDDRRGVVLGLVLLAHLRDAVRAEPCLAEAVAVARELGFAAGEAVALSGLGALDVAAASYAPARRRLTTAIELLEELGHELELRTAYLLRSVAAEELGDLAGALADAERSAELEYLAGTLADTERPAQLEYLAGTLADAGRSAAPAHDRAIRLAVRLGRGMTAWTHAERAKSLLLTAQLDVHRRPAVTTLRPHGRSGATSLRLAPASLRPRSRSAAFRLRGWPVPDGVPADLVQEEQRGLDAVRTLMTAARHTRDPIQAAALIGRARAARTGVEALWDRVEPLAPDHVALHRGTPPGRSRLNALLTPVSSVSGGTMTRGLLGFHVGEEGVTVLAHRTGWPEPRAFPTTVGHDILAAFTETIGGDRPGLLDIAARRHRLTLWRRLADLLLHDALEALGDDLDLLHLLPHQALHRVPLHALAPGGRLLLERFPVAYAPSAAALDRLARRGPARGGRSLALGYTPDAGERAAVEGTVEDAADLLGTRPRTGQEATAGLLPGDWDVAHLSCHGVYDRQDPFASGIRLADGLLTARQLMTTNVHAALLVLSACESGPAGGNDVSALGQALLHAGVRTALLTLWPVSAGITRSLMRDFHTRLRAGEGPAPALRAAVLELRELYGSAEADLWAPYVLVGLPHGG